MPVPQLMPAVPTLRVNPVNRGAVAPKGTHVLYWMIGQRRTRHSFALQHAVARAVELGKPLLVLEPLRVGYRWASDRHHRFVLDGMADQVAAFAAAGVTYLPYVEPEAGAGSGLLEALAASAACVITDEVPGFFLPRMVAAAGAKLSVRLEQVDGVGILPLRASKQAYPSASSFRRIVQKEGLANLLDAPVPDPLAALPRGLRDGPLPRGVARRWPAAAAALLAGDRARLAALPIDHSVPPIGLRGGARAAEAQVADFLDDRLDRYGTDRSEPGPDRDASSGLSPYLHFGHVGAHEIVGRVLARDDWDPSRTADARISGLREGWWGVSPTAEAFLDELVTWRELGHGFAFHRADDFDRYESLPPWARASLEAHAGDPRPYRYDLDTFARAATHDPLWNAAQTQLVRDGHIHNYLRMLWGKKILEWTRSPRHALDILIELNNRFAIDGRDANSYSGIFWTLGRFDRPWPERPIYGVIRSMSSERTAKKIELASYLQRYGAQPSLL